MEQRLIDAKKIVYSWTIDADGTEHDGVTLQSIIDKLPTVNAIVIPEGATNGELIKALFPSFDVEDKTEYFGRIRNLDDHFIKTDIDFWNSPYRKDGNNETV